MTITLLQPDGVPIIAQAERQGSAALYGGGTARPLGGRSGFRIGTPASVFSATATTWTLGPCAAMIDPGASTHQGMYGWATDAVVSGPLNAADPNYSRIDSVYIQVNDSSAGDGSGATSAPVAYLAGAPSATPAPPALPPRSFLVGAITVPKAGAGAPVAVLNPATFVAAGGVLPVYSPEDRATITAPYRGMEIMRMDLQQLSPSGVRERFNGNSWDHFGHAEFTTAANTAAPNTAWGMGNFTRDDVKTTDPDFIAVNGRDTLRIRDTGLYSIVLMPTFTAPIGGISWGSIDGTFTTPLTSGLVNFVVPMPSIILTAGQLLNPLLAHGSSGDRTFSSRIRITRIA